MELVTSYYIKNGKTGEAGKSANVSKQVRVNGLKTLVWIKTDWVRIVKTTNTF